MAVLDRSKQPTVYGIESPVIPSFEHEKFNNGGDLYVLKSGTQPIVRIDMCFKAGPLRAPKAGIARAVSIMIGEGIEGMTSEQIAEKIDYYGAQMWQRTTNQWGVLSILSLDKHVGSILPIIEQMIKAPTFPQKELDIFLDKEIQQLKVKLQKPNYYAAHTLQHLIYEEGSRYGRVSSTETLKSTTREELVAFHKEAYTPKDMKIFVSGQPSDQSLEVIRRAFGEEWTKGTAFDIEPPTYRVWDEQVKYIEMPNVMQASLQMNRVFLPIDHEDVLPMKVVNTIFGGYFGSRLMSNIREEKGLTYGIGSSLASRKKDGFMRISSEVEPTKYELVISEIFNEMERMRKEPVGDEELDMVRNYMKGHLLSKYETMLTGVDSLISLVLEDCDTNRDRAVYETIESITAEKIMELSNKYLKKEDFYVLVVR